MERFLIDTNVISDYLSGSMPENGLLLMDEIIDAIPNISIITQIELLCWNADAVTLNNVRNFITDSVIIDINYKVVEFCVTIRRQNRIKTPDAIIAATAMASGHILVTANEKDFINIEGLKFINPHKL